MHCGLPKWATDPADPRESPLAPPSPPVELTSTPAALTIVVPARRNDALLSFLRIWVFAWAIGETLGAAVLATRPLEPFAARFTLVWLALWTTAGLLASTALAWMTRGRTVLAAGDGCLSIRRELLGFRRTRSLDLARVRSVRVVVPDARSLVTDGAARLGLVGPVVELESGAGASSLCSFPDAEQAERAARALAERSGAGAFAGTVARRWRPRWFLPLLAANMALGGAFLSWLGGELEGELQGCLASRPGGVQAVCSIPSFVTWTGAAMAALGVLLGAVVVARRLRGGDSTARS